MDKSEFLPTASSTIKKRKYRQSEDEDYHQQINTKKEATFEEEQRRWARNSAKTNNVAGIPSKYFKPNFSNSESKMTSFNETTISDTDLLNSRSSHLNDFLIHPNNIIDNNIGIVNFISDYSYMFKSEEEAAEMLLADELSWRQKNEWPIQEEQFSDFNCCDKVSLGQYFSERCNTLSDFIDAKSPQVTGLPVALIKPSFSSIEELSVSKKKNKGLTVSTIHKSPAFYNSPKEVDYLYKLRAKPQKSLSFQTKINSLPATIDSFYETCGSENKEQEQTYNRKNINSLNSDSQDLPLVLKNYNLPLETTATDLVWGCVQVGKSVSQEFFIRNKSAKRIGLQLSLSNQQFKLKENDNRDSESISTDKIVLQANKSKAVIVSFVPTNVGAAVGELYFTPLDPTLNQLNKQCIKLYGYGGLFKVDFHNLARDIAGKYWLSFGKLDERTVLTTRFNVKNKGDVPAFVHISIHSLDSTKIQVSPNFFVLALREDKEIVVSYKPSKEDYYLKSVYSYSTKVVDLGNLKITFGSEVDRGRIRNICKKCVEKGLNIAPIAHILEEKIKEEMMPIDLIKFREPAHSLKDMVSFLNHQYINLTLERDPQETVQMKKFSKKSNAYQPLYQESTITSDENSLYYCNVVPALLILALPYKHKDTIFLKSSKKQKLNFIASCQYSDLDLKPREGILEPYGTVMITVKYSSEFTVGKKLFTVLIIVENEIFEVNVEVEYLGYEKNKSKSLFSCIL